MPDVAAHLADQPPFSRKHRECRSYCTVGTFRFREPELYRMVTMRAGFQDCVHRTVAVVRRLRSIHIDINVGLGCMYQEEHMHVL